MTVLEIQQYIDKVLDPPLRTPEQRIENLEFALREVKRWIGELETKAKWEIDGHHRRCKKCGEYFCINDREGDEIPHNFCGNCGAKMEVEDE